MYDIVLEVFLPSAARHSDISRSAKVSDTAVYTRRTSELLVLREEFSEPFAAEHEILNLLRCSGQYSIKCCFSQMLVLGRTATAGPRMSLCSGLCRAVISAIDRGVSIDGRGTGAIGHVDRWCRHDSVGIAQTPDVHEHVVCAVPGDERAESVLECPSQHLFSYDPDFSTHFVILRVDANGVRNDQRSHLLLDCPDLVKRQHDLIQVSKCRLRYILRLTSVTQPKMLAWKHKWFSDTYSRPWTRISFARAQP